MFWNYGARRAGSTDISADRHLGNAHNGFHVAAGASHLWI